MTTFESDKSQTIELNTVKELVDVLNQLPEDAILSYYFGELDWDAKEGVLYIREG